MRGHFARFSSILFAATLFHAVASADWVVSEWGETGIFSMENAPFPHESRKDGHTYKNRFFSAEEHYSDSSVALFIPKGYEAGERIHLLYYFHGWGNNIRKAMDEFHLREMVAGSEKNVIMVFPEGPKNASDSTCGRLEEEGAFRALTDEVLGKLQEEGRIPHGNLGDVALSGHSGAYRVIARGLEHGGLEDHVSDVYLLDASYALTESYIDWIERREDGHFRSVFTEHLREENVGMMNALVEKRIAFQFSGDGGAGNSDCPAHRVFFVGTSKLDHNGAVSLLGPWLTASDLEPFPVGSSE